MQTGVAKNSLLGPVLCFEQNESWSDSETRTPLALFPSTQHVIYFAVADMLASKCAKDAEMVWFQRAGVPTNSILLIDESTSRYMWLLQCVCQPGIETCQCEGSDYVSLIPSDHQETATQLGIRLCKEIACGN